MKVSQIERFNEDKISSFNLDPVLEEVKQIIANVDAAQCFTKSSEEKTMFGTSLYSPTAFNDAYKREFSALAWERARIYNSYLRTKAEYDNSPVRALNFVIGPKKKSTVRDEMKTHRFDEVDFYKRFGSHKVIVEVQFGKYAFHSRDAFVKSLDWYNQKLSDLCIAICPMDELTGQMSTGVGFFEKNLYELCTVGIHHPYILIGVNP